MILICLISCLGNGCGDACQGREACGVRVVESNGGLTDENVHCWESNGHCGDCTMEILTAYREKTCLLLGVGVGLQGEGEMAVS